MAETPPPRPAVGAPTLFELGLNGPDGDAVAARAFANALLEPVAGSEDRRDARLLLTALCLHLQGRNAPDPTAADLVSLLEDGRARQDFPVLRLSPTPLLHYAACELADLAPAALSVAVETCLQTAKLISARP